MNFSFLSNASNCLKKLARRFIRVIHEVHSNIYMHICIAYSIFANRLMFKSFALACNDNCQAGIPTRRAWELEILCV
jgi:hypothetical protein